MLDAMLPLVVRLVVLGLLVCETASAECVASTHYRIVALPLKPAAINDRHQVAGTSSRHRAVWWSEKTGLKELTLPRGFVNSDAVAINNAGHVVVLAANATFSHRQTFLYVDQSIQLLQGVRSRAFGINDADVVVGESIAPETNVVEPVVWKKNVRYPVETCCGGTAKAINEHGDMVGDAYDSEGRYHAFMRVGAGPSEILAPDGGFSAAIGINDKDHVVVQAGSRVFLYQSGTSAALALSPRFPSSARAINDCDVIVGSFGPFADANRAFIWTPASGFQDLNGLLPAGTRWTLESAVSINNLGEIVGRGDYQGHDDGGYLLVPGS